MPVDLLGGGGVQVGAEGRHLDHLVVAAAAEHHVHDAKAPADDEGAPEQRLHLLGRGVGGDVEVLRPQADQQVAHRAADDVGLVAGRPSACCTTLTARSSTSAGSMRVLGRPAPRRACPAGSRPLRCRRVLPSSLSMNLLDHVEQAAGCASRARARCASSAGAGVGGHRVAGALEQRQVVGRIAVEHADALEVGQAQRLALASHCSTRRTLPSR